MNSYFLEEEMQMVYKYMKKCSTSLTIREMEMKITLRFCISPEIMIVIKIANNSQC